MTGGFLVIEALSFLLFSSAIGNGLMLIVLTLSVIALTAYRLEYGFLILLSELFIGSMGHTFFINLLAGQLPLRIALWLSFMFVFAVKFVWQFCQVKTDRKYFQNLKSFGFSPYFLGLFIFMAIALVNGIMRGQAPANIFSDFNSWLFFLLIIPAVAIYGGQEEGKIKRLQTVFIAAAIWMSLKTLIFLYIFTHNTAIAPEVYNWLRRTLNGEMTATTAGWPRIFIQGQIYTGVAFFLTLWVSQAEFKFKQIFQRKNIWLLALAALFMSSLIISFSRSFWMGLLAAAGLSIVLIWRIYSFKKVLISAAWMLLSFVGSFIIIYAVAAFPYIYRTNFQASLLDRVSNGGESAITSRWSLLPVLMKEIMKEPVFGQGYGATITYQSSDPRVLQNNPDGQYTTYAFEWGYLDLWLKMGFLGVASYLLLIVMLIIANIRQGIRAKQFWYFGLAAALVFLAITNVFTPYLNHPLGIGMIIICSCLIPINKIY